LVSEPTAAFLSQLPVAPYAALLLEALFARMASARRLEIKVLQTIALALAVGVVYFVALYLWAIRQTPTCHRGGGFSSDTLLASALAFH
jgi:hypothetical protein